MVFMRSGEKHKKHLVKESSFFWFFFWSSKKRNRTYYFTNPDLKKMQNKNHAMQH